MCMDQGCNKYGVGGMQRTGYAKNMYAKVLMLI